MKRVCVLVLLAFALGCAFAAEFERGAVRLVLDESCGRFLLYSKGADSRYTPLFFDRDPRTSFLSVLVNDRAYKLGDSSSFSVRLDAEKPAFVFESAQLIVREEFAFIKSAGSDVENGVEITVTVESKSASVNAGFRLLLDTFLGESGSPHFYLDSLTVSGETLAPGSGAVWVSKNNSASLMGSIAPPAGNGPNSVHFANWKRLTDATWKVPFESGRNFNAPPYSIQDSAVCYYFEPRALARAESFSAVILLSTEDNGGFAAPVLAAVPVEPEAEAAPETPPAAAPVVTAPVVEDQRLADLAVLNDMIKRLDEYIAAGTVTEEELAAMEQTLDRFSLKYGIGPGTYR